MNPQNERTLHGRSTGFKDQKRINGRDRQPQYNDLPRNLKPFDVDQHIRAINRAMGDAYVLLRDWPYRIRYSFMVGRNGKLLVRSERDGAK